MTSERIQRRIDRLLDVADEAGGQLNRQAVRDRAQVVLALNPSNAEALTFTAIADRSLDGEQGAPAGDEDASA